MEQATAKFISLSFTDTRTDTNMPPGTALLIHKGPHLHSMSLHGTRSEWCLSLCLSHTLVVCELPILGDVMHNMLV